MSLDRSDFLSTFRLLNRPDEALTVQILIFNFKEEHRMTQYRGGAGNFAADKERAAEAGRKGGQKSGGNFKNDPERAIEAGRKGGKVSRRS